MTPYSSDTLRYHSQKFLSSNLGLRWAFSWVLFSWNLASDQGCVRCRVDSEDWFHVLCVCPAYGDICRLDDMGVYVVDSTFDIRQCLASTDTLQYSNAYARAAFRWWRELLDATSSAVWWMNERFRYVLNLVIQLGSVFSIYANRAIRPESARNGGYLVLQERWWPSEGIEFGAAYFRICYKKCLESWVASAIWVRSGCSSSVSVGKFSLTFILKSSVLLFRNFSSSEDKQKRVCNTYTRLLRCFSSSWRGSANLIRLLNCAFSFSLQSTVWLKVV